MLIDLYGSTFKDGVLDKLCRHVRRHVLKYGYGQKYYPKGVCAGGKRISLYKMNSSYSVVYLLLLVARDAGTKAGHDFGKCTGCQLDER